MTSSAKLLPTITNGELYKNYMTDAERWVFDNLGEHGLALDNAYYRFLEQHRSDEFPTNAEVGSVWFDASGTPWTFAFDEWFQIPPLVNENRRVTRNQTHGNGGEQA